MYQALNVQLLKQHANIVFSSENVTHFSLGHLGIMYQAHCTASNGKLGRDLGTRLTHQIIGSSTSTAGQDSRHLSCLTKLSVHIFAAIPLSLHPLDTIQSYLAVNRLDPILDYHSKFPSLCILHNSISFSCQGVQNEPAQNCHRSQTICHCLN